MKNTASKSKFLLIAMIATLIGVGIHIYLTLHYYDIKFGLSAGDSMCNINEVLNCDAVTASKFSALLGVPIALWGAMTNLVLVYFLGVTRFNLVQDSDRTSRYALLLSGVTVVASVVMGLISVTAMSNLCIFCISAYVLSIIGFIFTWMGAEDVTAENISNDIKDIFTSERWVAGFLLAIPAFAFLANIMYLESHGLSDVEKMAKEKVAYWQVAPQQNFDLTKGLSMQKGTEEPVMTIVEFADFRCGHCKHAAAPLHNFTKNHPDVRLIYKPFPLDGTCNEAMKNGGGDGISCGLAFATLCSEKIAQKGWVAHDYIFDNQEEITRMMNLDKNLESIATATGIQLEELKTCVKGTEIPEVVRNTAKEGEVAQIRGTPAIFVNGKLLDSGQLIPVLEAAYKTLKK
ncbi:fused vitamin K epoxide reductase/thioredoxin [Bdellovibrio bacteriovorus]|uniref:Thiol:disulfide interchange protein dsbA n=1 Tax=Bdellovibrio bacteriovorus str. Tiberius TaxID=1069642 RepID=K7YYH1_BDEBC|nr:fused vitamin K epoxide reductase/thioredoxin [Bdellovibrio bacteriovorus]AFY01755.1 Thiol:disulfide interchange protein dsbA precursor [Bdellovibrio bacteriovorus str. Tiberius]